MTARETAPNPSQAMARVLFDELVRGGVSDVVMSPGSRSTALVTAADDDPRLRLHVALDERSAAFIALGIARVQRRPAAVVTTSGSAVANLLPAVLEAHHGRVPLVLMTADRPPELRGTGANQTIDQVDLFGGAVRYAVDLLVAQDCDDAVARWRAVAARAAAHADGRLGIPGPVHLNIPFREPTVAVSDDGRSRAEPFTSALDGRAEGRPWLDVHPVVSMVEPEALQELAGRILGTERGVVVVGDLADTEGVGAAVAVIAAAAGWPVIAEPQTGARGGPHVIAHASLLLATPFAASHRPDLVLRVGRPTISGPVGRWLPSSPQVLIDPSPPLRAPDGVTSSIAADPVELLSALADLLALETSSSWLDEWRAADEVAAHAIDTVLGVSSSLGEPRLARDVMASVPTGGLLLVGSSLPIRDVEAYAPARIETRVVANRGTSGIDGFVGTVMGAALAHDGPTVALLGDLTFLHDRNGFLLSPDAPMPDVVFVVVDNDGGGIFHQLPQREHVPAFERLFGTPHGLDLGEVARTHRLPYTLLADAGEVGVAVRAACDAGGIHVLHARTDRDRQTTLRRHVVDHLAAEFA